MGDQPNVGEYVQLDIDGLPDRTYWNVAQFIASYDGDPDDEGAEQVARDEAFLVASLTTAGTHRPVLDVDHVVQVVKSSAGHAHLYIDVEVEHEPYMRLLDALAECGIIEHGYANASKARGMTRVRKPDKLEGDKPW